jgi:hypothetical protein
MDRIKSLLERVDEDRMRRCVFALAKDPFPFRKLNYTIPGHEKSTLHEVDDWIEAKLRGVGYEVEREACRVQAWPYDASFGFHHEHGWPDPGAPFYTAYNLYASRIGRTRPDEIILLLAHKDSQSWVDSPGANDNAVGTTGVLEIATLLADYACERTIRFLWVNEEHYPWTSGLAAANAWSRADNILAVFNVDGISAKTDEEVTAGHKPSYTVHKVPQGRRIADVMDRVNDEYSIGLAHAGVYADANADDGMFVRAGYPCAAIILGSFPYADPQYHFPGDVPERVDYPHARMVTQAILAAVLTLDAGLA